MNSCKCKSGRCRSSPKTLRLLDDHNRRIRTSWIYLKLQVEAELVRRLPEWTESADDLETQLAVIQDTLKVHPEAIRVEIEFVPVHVRRVRLTAIQEAVARIAQAMKARMTSGVVGAEYWPPEVVLTKGSSGYSIAIKVVYAWPPSPKVVLPKQPRPRGIETVMAEEDARFLEAVNRPCPCEEPDETT